MRVELVIIGRPQQQGSGSRVGGRNVYIDSNQKKLMPWRAVVAAAAVEAMLAQGRDVIGSGRWDTLITDPVELTAWFYFNRPKCHFRTGKFSQLLKTSAPAHHAQKPDLDKLLRAACDALTGSLWRDDSQVARIRAAGRAWTTGAERAEIVVETLE